MKKFLIAISILLFSLAGHSQIKAFLSGAWPVSGTAHKPVTTTWLNVLKANALTQPYWVAPFSYGNISGPETVLAPIFTSNTTTDIVDWVLLELWDNVPTPTNIYKRAAFIREDGQIVDLDGTSAVNFNLYTTVPDGNYYLVIRHRNHLGIRSSITLQLNNGILSSYDFSTAQTLAYQNTAITTNAAQTLLTGGTFYGMWGGNDIQEQPGVCNTVKIGAPYASSDFYFLFYTALGGDPTVIISNVYNIADLNMDGTIRVSGPPSINDYLFLVGITLGGNVTKVIKEHL